MTLGLHFALTAADEKRLLSSSAGDRFELVNEEFEENYPDEWICDSDVRWDAIHRALNGGQLSYDFNTPIEGVILGGKSLSEEDDYVISYKTAAQVAGIAAALARLDKARFREGYFAIDPEEYGDKLSEYEFEACWSTVEELRDFYARAAAAARSVIFTV
jgi:hypothetical protein